jgi:hypothetical protein
VRRWMGPDQLEGTTRQALRLDSFDAMAADWWPNARIHRNRSPRRPV